MKNVIITLLATIFLFSACASKIPKVELPDNQTEQEQISEQEKNETKNEVKGIQEKWWEIFNDTTLNSLEEEAIKYNYDLKQAMSRMKQSKAKLAVARSYYFPLVDVFGEISDSKTNKLFRDNGFETNKFTVGLMASYEINLWGEYFKNAKSAKKDFLASKVDKDAVKLMLTAQVAQTYFTVLALNDQYTIAKETLKIREDSYNVYNSRFKKGVINELDLRRVEAEMESVRAQVYETDAQLKAAQSSLNVLVGKTPKFIVQNTLEPKTKIENISANICLPKNIPSDLLTKRPDIKAIEYKIESISASASSVKSEMFPKISLTGMAGVASQELEDLFKKDEDGNYHDTWNYSGRISMPLFYGGRKIKNYKVAKEQYEEMSQEYLSTVQTAFKEALDAINNVEISKQTIVAYKKQESALSRSYILAKKRQKAGLTDLLDVLDVQRMWLQAQMALVNARKSQLVYIVDVCKSLGGGWKEEK